MPNIFIAGDSIVYGKWDSEGGWAARLRRHFDGKYNIGKRTNLLLYALGVPSEPTVRFVTRLRQELEARMDGNGKNLLMLGTGLNDSCPNNKVTGECTPPEIFKQSYGECIDIGRELGCEVIALGLTPVNPARSKGLLFSEALVAEYDGYVSEVCREKGIPKMELLDRLISENFADHLVDAAHPDAEGHARIFEIVAEYLETKGVVLRLVSGE